MFFLETTITSGAELLRAGLRPLSLLLQPAGDWEIIRRDWAGKTSSTSAFSPPIFLSIDSILGESQ
jgi:hypothetical protein